MQCNYCDQKGYTTNDSLMCKECRGIGFIDDVKILTIDIPEGCKDKHKITKEGEGNEGEGEPGNLYIIINEKPHDIFSRRQQHLIIEKSIDLVDALTGYREIIPILDGTNILISTEDGDVIHDGDIRVVPRKGMKTPQGNGDIIIKFKVILPTSLTKEQLKGLSTILQKKSVYRNKKTTPKVVLEKKYIEMGHDDCKPECVQQ